jgi:hypothetical protein
MNAYSGKYDTDKYLKLNGADSIKVCATFTQDFIDKYKYEDSTNYRFALNVKVNGV